MLLYTRFPEQLLFEVGTIYPLQLHLPVISETIDKNPVRVNSMVFSYLSGHLLNKVGGGGGALCPP
jgi:hypothetical protein